MDNITDTIPAPPIWFVMGLAGAAGSVWGKRLAEDRPLLGHVVYILGLALIAIGHGRVINWAYARFAGRGGLHPGAPGDRGQHLRVVGAP